MYCSHTLGFTVFLVSICFAVTDEWNSGNEDRDPSNSLYKGKANAKSVHQYNAGNWQSGQALAASRKWKQFSKTSQISDENVFQFLAKAVQGREELVRGALGPVFQKLPDGEHLLEDVLSGFRESVSNDEEGDSILCRVCSLLLTALKIAGSRGIIVWDDLYDPVYFLCITIGPILVPHLRADVLCSGTLHAQGPYAFDAITRMTVPTGRRHCEFLNVCFPQPENNAAYTNILSSIKTFGKQTPIKEDEKKGANLENAFKILQLTDIHIEDLYEEGTETECFLPVCCLPRWGPGRAGPYGSYECNTPPRTLDLILNKINELEPDLVIYTGDSPPHTVWEETFTSQLECTRQILDAFNRKLRDMKIYPNIGNHEMYPTNIYFQGLANTTNMNYHFTELWHTFANFSAENNNTMNAASYYSKVVFPGLRILSYNTNFMYTMNFYNPVTDNIIPDRNNRLRGMENFMRNVLEDAKAAGEKVLVVGHHPPGRTDSIVQFSRWITNLHLEFSDVIIFQMSGHTHRDEFKMFTNKTTGEAKGMVYVAPAVSPGGFINPSFRMYYLDNRTFDLLDFDNYHIDLQKITGVTPTPEVELQYRATKEYNLADLSPSSWQQFVHRMMTDYDLFMVYHRNFHTHSPVSDNCDPDLCRTRYLCSVMNTNFDEYQKCVEVNTPTTTTISTTSTTIMTTTLDPINNAPLIEATCTCLIFSAITLLEYVSQLL